MSKEIPIVFSSAANSLVGIIHQSELQSNKGVIIVVGGPQTRVGSHRAFVELARFLARNGVNVLRFDYTGAGDSDGKPAHFTEVAKDIDAAVDIFIAKLPQLDSICLWGLCDAASAIALYMNSTSKSEHVERLVLLNPWVNQPHTQAQTFLKFYYLKRIFSRDFWQKLFTGNVALMTSAKEIHSFSKQSQQISATHYVENMLAGLKQFDGKVLIIIAENDLTGQEFCALVAKNKQWRSIMARNTTEIITVESANHTFAQRQWKETINKLSLKLIQT